MTNAEKIKIKKKIWQIREWLAVQYAIITINTHTLNSKQKQLKIYNEAAEKLLIELEDNL